MDAKRLYETTVRRQKYFGVALGEKEAARFWLFEFHRMYYKGPMKILASHYKDGPPEAVEDDFSPAAHDPTACPHCAALN